jgi:SWI/SNF-related matrix-associated actin-dependent regulator of chromatin subfamily A member 5
MASEPTSNVSKPSTINKLMEKLNDLLKQAD